MSKGRPGIVRPNYPPSPSFSPAIMPRSRSPPRAPGSRAASLHCYPLLYAGLPRGFISFFPCLLIVPSPITHVSTFSRHHAAPRPALLPSLALGLLPPT